MQELVRRQLTVGVEENLFGLQFPPQRVNDRAFVAVVVSIFGRYHDWYFSVYNYLVVVVVLLQKDEALRESASLRRILREKGNHQRRKEGNEQGRGSAWRSSWCW